jgi:hypothetical protein
VRRRVRDDSGQTAPLIIGFTLILAMMVVVVVDATAAYLRRQALLTLADGAALAAADGIEGRQVYLSGLDERAMVDPAAARGLVASYLFDVEAARRYPGLGHSVETDGERVVVHVVAPLDLPLPLPGIGDSTRVGAVGAAVITLSQ